MDERPPLGEKFRAVVYFLLFLVVGTMVSFGIRTLKGRFHGEIVECPVFLTGLFQGHFTGISHPDFKEPLGGVSNLKGHLEGRLREGGWKKGDYLFFDLGDSWFGHPFTNYTRGEFFIQLQNALGLDGMLLGNLEFSYQPAIFKARQKQCQFPLLSSNLTRENGDSPPGVLPHRVFTIQGHKIGVIAISPLDGNAIILRENIPNLEFKGVPFVQHRLKNELMALKCDTIVALSQIVDSEINQDMLEAFRELGVEVLVKVVYAKRFPVIENRGGLHVVNLSGGNRGQFLTAIRLQFDKHSHRLQQVVGERIPVVPLTGGGDPELGVRVEEYIQKVRTTLDIPVGICGVRIPKALDEPADPQRDDQESPLGNLVADFMRKASGCELAFINSGALRDELKKGEVTNGDIFRCFPFDDDLYTAEMEGYLIESALETSAAMKYGLLQVSGLAYEIDLNRREGERVKSVTVNGQPLARDKKYTIVINNFLKGGGDGFLEFSRLGNYQRQKDRLQQLIRDSIRNQSPVLAKLENRIVIHGSRK